MKKTEDPLQKLITAARQADAVEAPEIAAPEPPVGLAERLGARWAAIPLVKGDQPVWWQPSWAAVATAALVMFLSLGVHSRRQETVWQPDTLVQQSLQQTFLNP